MSQLIRQIPNLRGGHLSVYQDEGTVIIGARVLDLEGVAELVSALDECARLIRVWKDAHGG